MKIQFKCIHYLQRVANFLECVMASVVILEPEPETRLD